MAKINIDESVSANDSNAENYYQDDGRQRKSVASLLAGVSMIATIAICLGVFFGGRAAYREFTSKTIETAPTETSNTTFVSTNSLPTTPPTQATTPIVTKPAPTPEPTPTPVPAPVVTPQVQQTPVKTKLTNTGPGNILANFIAITTLATLSHYAYNRRRLQA